MSNVIFITHTNIQLNLNTPVPDWHLSGLGRNCFVIDSGSLDISEAWIAIDA